MSNITQDVIALNDYTQERRRTTSTGTKSRYTITINAEPILHNFSELNLGAGPAEAIQAVVMRQIKNITEVAAPSTILRRQNGAKGLASGKPSKSDKRRYSGGRTGLKTPSGSVRKFNDSGRLAEGVLVRQNTVEKNWTINVPANRLDPSTFRSRGDFLRMVEDLYRLVPALANPLLDRDVVNAIEQGVEGVLMRKLERGEQLRDALAKARLELAKRLVGA